MIRDYIYVEDVANAYFIDEKMVNSKERLSYNVGSKENLTVKNFVKLITIMINKKEIAIIKNNSKIEIYKKIKL